ncbi:hypothetical protein P280DRAFT_482666 [Massarina eburnea CBS 473.64]|uniref:Uncharacterized protein n=1 Tax=Massarina eburnea CBS 473.64 TaxID=1395130 RepID=A0A6A6RQW4_9PLEO|nr:hypothetical protein P280DRAFT_482666 [Massarina eburnea CBS 473.64]
MPLVERMPCLACCHLLWARNSVVASSAVWGAVFSGGWSCCPRRNPNLLACCNEASGSLVLLPVYYRPLRRRVAQGFAAVGEEIGREGVGHPQGSARRPVHRTGIGSICRHQCPACGFEKSGGEVAGVQIKLVKTTSPRSALQEMALQRHSYTGYRRTSFMSMPAHCRHVARPGKRGGRWTAYNTHQAKMPSRNSAMGSLQMPKVWWPLCCVQMCAGWSEQRKPTHHGYMPPHRTPMCYSFSQCTYLDFDSAHSPMPQYAHIAAVVNGVSGAGRSRGWGGTTASFNIPPWDAAELHNRAMTMPRLPFCLPTMLEHAYGCCCRKCIAGRQGAGIAHEVENTDKLSRLHGHVGCASIDIMPIRRCQVNAIIVAAAVYGVANGGASCRPSPERWEAA